MDEKQKKISEMGKAMRVKLERDEKIARRIRQLGEARAGDPARIETEDQVLDEVTSIIDTEELQKIITQLEWLGDKKLAQIDTYIENSVTDFANAKEFLRVLAKALWGTLNIVRILSNRELPPEQ